MSFTYLENWSQLFEILQTFFGKCWVAFCYLSLKSVSSEQRGGSSVSRVTFQSQYTLYRIQGKCRRYFN